jgi:8-oxo-dGTP diphosphatase
MKQVTAAIWIYQGKVLIARRPVGDRLAGLWEFPGGKIETGETPQACLEREMAEEFGVNVHVGPFFGRSLYTYENGAIELLAYRISGAPQALELRAHSQYCWAGRSELNSYPFAPADIPLVDRLKEFIPH